MRAAIYYLDSPGAAGDLVVSFNGSSNGVVGSLLALSNTAAGKPAVTAEGGRAAQLTTPVKNAFLVVSHVSNDHSPSALATARDPLTPLFDGPVGSAAGGSGYMFVKSPGAVTPAFSGNEMEPVTVAVAFAPHP